MSDPALNEAVELADALVNELLPDQGSGGSWAFALALKLQASVASQAATLEAMASALEPFSDLADFFDSWEKPLPDTASINRATTIGHLRTARATLTQYRQGDL